VTLPALLPLVLGWQFRFALTTLLLNVAILALVYLVVGFGWSSSCGGSSSGCSRCWAWP
jgi:hypothetical protein